MPAGPFVVGIVHAVATPEAHSGDRECEFVAAPRYPGDVEDLLLRVEGRWRERGTLVIAAARVDQGIMPLTTTTAPEIARPMGVAEFVVLCSPQDSRPAG